MRPLILLLLIATVPIIAMRWTTRIYKAKERESHDESSF
jgi:hypothetical protein